MIVEGIIRMDLEGSFYNLMEVLSRLLPAGTV
jgi:hypothetical protein